MDRRLLRKWRGWLRRTVSPALQWGDLRRLEPVDRFYGARRGQPIDRYYIERFLAANQDCIRGDVLETGYPDYTRLFGGGRTTRSHVLNAVAGNRRATLVGDLASPGLLPAGSLDCIILTQTLQYIFDPAAALRNCHEALKPGGTLLITVPAIAKISRDDMDATGDYWRFTSAAMRRLLSAAFGESQIVVDSHGNVLAAAALLYGLAAEEVSPAELDHKDPDYEVLVTGRCTRSG